MKTLFRLLLIVFIFSVGLFLISHYLMELNSAKTLSQVIQRYHVVFTVWRYGLYALVLIFWPYCIEKLGMRQKWSVDAIVFLSKQRLKVLGLILLVEIFFVCNFPGHLIMWLQTYS